MCQLSEHLERPSRGLLARGAPVTHNELGALLAVAMATGGQCRVDRRPVVSTLEADGARALALDSVKTLARLREFLACGCQCLGRRRTCCLESEYLSCRRR